MKKIIKIICEFEKAIHKKIMSIRCTIKDINDSGIDSFLSSYVKQVLSKFSNTDRRLSDVLDEELCLKWSTVRPMIETNTDTDSPFTDQTLEQLSDIIALIATIDDIYGHIIDTNEESLLRITRTDRLYDLAIR